MSNEQSIQRFFGIDLGKRESQLCLLDSRGEVIGKKRFVSSVSNFREIAAEASENDTIAFEMTTNAFALARLFGAKQRLARSPITAYGVGQFYLLVNGSKLSAC